MTKKFTLTLLITIALALIAAAQEPSQARDLFKSYSPDGASGRAGAKVRIELRRGQTRSFVAPTYIFRAGDKVKFHFETNFPAYVRVYSRGSSGKLARLFPYGSGNARVEASSDYVLPSAPDEWFEFDQQAGVEKIYFGFSSQPPTPPAKQTAQAKPPAAKKPTYQPDIATARQVGEPDAPDAWPDEDASADDWTESRDIKRVQDGNEQYIFGQSGSTQRVVRITFRLQHQ